MIVADTNLIVYHAFESDLTEAARRVAEADPEWIVPPLWRMEFRSVLLQYMKVNGLSVDLAQEILSLHIRRFRGSEFAAPDDLVLRVAREYGTSAYDAEYVALALVHKKPLVTADQRLLKAVPGVALSLAEFAGA